MSKKVFFRKSPELAASLTIQNMYIIRIIAIVTAIIQVFSLAWSYIYFEIMKKKPGFDARPDQLAYIIMMMVSLFTFFMITKYKKDIKNYINFIGAIIFIYLESLVVYGIFISVRDVVNGGNTYVFITAIIVVFDIAIMNPFLSIFTSIASYVVLIMCIGTTGKMYTFDCVNMLYLLIYLNIISVIRYYAMCRLLVVQSELDNTNKILENISFFDELSHTKNRNALRQDWQDFYGRTICVAMIDIDGFKKFNDEFGHTIGDCVIESIGHALVQYFGKDVVYRIGGDEFLIVTDISEEDFNVRLINAKMAINDIKSSETRLNVTISAGCYHGKCRNDEDMRNMMNKADELLYIVKKNGKNGLKTQTEDD